MASVSIANRRPGSAPSRKRRRGRFRRASTSQSSENAGERRSDRPLTSTHRGAPSHRIVARATTGPATPPLRLGAEPGRRFAIDTDAIRPVNSSGSGTAAIGHSSAASAPIGSSTTGPPTSCSRGRHRTATDGVDTLRRRAPERPARFPERALGSSRRPFRATLTRRRRTVRTRSHGAQNGRSMNFAAARMRSRTSSEVSTLESIGSITPTKMVRPRGACSLRSPQHAQGLWFARELHVEAPHLETEERWQKLRVTRRPRCGWNHDRRRGRCARDSLPLRLRETLEDPVVQRDDAFSNPSTHRAWMDKRARLNRSGRCRRPRRGSGGCRFRPRRRDPR